MSELHGLEPAEHSLLARAGIHTTNNLLDACGTPEGRAKVGEVTGIGDQKLLFLAHQADLMRLDDLGPQQITLLRAAGVDNVAAMAEQDAEALASSLHRVNQREKMFREAPHVSAVRRWTTAAVALGPRVR